MRNVGLFIKWVLSLVIISIITSYPLLGFGEGDVLNKFDVTPVESATQFDKKVSYFDLLLRPNQKEKIKVMVTNDQDKDLDLKISVNPAITNSNGVVEYAGGKEVGSSVAPYTINDMVMLKEKELKLKPKEKHEVEVEVDMPDKDFPGVVAGAIYIEEVPQGEAEGNVRNILSREIAILLRTNDKPVKPEITFQEIKGIHTNARNAIEVNMENVSPTYIKDVSVEYDITYKGNEFFKGKKDNMKIAPSSLFPLSIPLEGKEFEAGVYEAHIIVSSGENKWEEKEKFTIEKDQAKELNDTAALDEKPAPFPWMTVALIAILLAFILLAFYLIRKNRKLHEKLAKQNKSKKSKKGKKSSASKRRNRTKNK